MSTFWLPDLDKAIAAQRAASHETVPDLDDHETLTALLAATIPPPMTLLQGLLYEGLILFGGKSKRGKSWLIFDLAISVATGRAGFGHFACPTPQPVLFLALEDGRRRLQSRAYAIQDNLKIVDNFHLRYRFPALAEGGIAQLAQLIERYHYGLIVIDVLAKLEPMGKGKGEKSYHEVYSMFNPLQELRKNHPFALVMLTHLRKQDAEDAFDSLHGSVAYQGAQDMLWVLERKPKDAYAYLHVRGKDIEETTLALHQQRNGPWEYIGEGEEYALNKTQRDIMQVLHEEKDRDLSIQEILKACGLGEDRYAYVRKTLSMMAKDDLIHRSQHGKYGATMRGLREVLIAEDDGSDIPF